MLSDSHCHLNSEEFSGKIDLILKRAQQNNVERILTISVKLEDAEELDEISNSYDNVYYSVGIHPHYASMYRDRDIKKEINNLLKKDKAVAIGEVGLDYYYKNSEINDQIMVFESMLEASKQNNIPIVIHTRNAEEDTINCIDNIFKINDVCDNIGVFHCFSSSIELAKKALDRSFLISFSGMITFKKSSYLREIVKMVPLDRMLIETDAPYLTPEPFRGKVNEPFYVKYVAQAIAEIKNISIENVEKITTENFSRIFGI